MSMFPTRIDIPLEKRTKLIELLNARLADLIDLQLQTKQAHWNVKGPSFIALHEMFDEFVDEIAEYVDDVAERVTALGGVAEGTVAVVHKRSSLEPYPLILKTGKEHLEAVAKALTRSAKAVREAIGQSDDLDADTADLFTGISRGLDKKLWFVEAHLHADH
ncbi:DNA starvation/stationary phase protection protein Dps [Telmatocola sphagniphila]|uniref:DNA starvation/stationary phase protection protein Dps n=2 Tax=Telmatocola sphagniphila TaxID=1123043 RepID=A0A8E6B1X6_9BACT|nr:DNA starvation/stationary phase protection protein Dps [Telmatocola sphagniphila]